MCVLCIGTANALVIADADGPYTGNEGSPITLDSSGSFIGGGSVLGSMPWDFGDGSNNSSEINPSHIYLDNSSYGITLYVNSTTGENDTDTTSAVINNVAPTVGPINDVFTESGSLVELMVSFSDPGILDNPWDFEFHWGDGFLNLGRQIRCLPYSPVISIQGRLEPYSLVTLELLTRMAVVVREDS